MPARLKLSGRRNKYANKKTVVDGLLFDSKKEGARWLVLKEKYLKGEIRNLRRQVRFELCVNGVTVGSWRADFTYIENGVFVAEDVKGFRTREYALKCKLVRALYGLEIRET